MDFLKLAKSRRSVRTYTGGNVSKDHLKRILEAGRWAPSALNKQPWRFIVVTEKSIKSRIREVYDKVRDELGLYKQDTRFLEKTVLIIVLSNSELPGHDVSTALAVENMLLAATDLGYGSLVMSSPFMGEDNVRVFKEMLGIPEPYMPLFIVAVGESDGDTPVKERLQLDRLVSYNKFSPDLL
jgi:nitroreductase